MLTMGSDLCGVWADIEDIELRCVEQNTVDAGLQLTVSESVFASNNT